MATVTQSLFGIDPEALMAERDRQARAQALQVAQLDPLQQARYTSSLATNQLGNAVGGLLGVQDPELMRVRQRQQMLQGLDITNPVSLRAAAQKALEANDFAAAQELAGRAAAVEQQQATLSKTKVEEQRLIALGEKEQAAATKLEEANLREENLRKELASLPSTATDKDVEEVVRKYGSPDKIFSILQNRQKAEADRQAKADLEREKLEQRDRELQFRREQAAANAALRNSVTDIQRQVAQARLDALTDRQAEKQEKADLAKTAAVNHATKVITDVQDASGLVRGMTTGLVGKGQSFVPGTDAFNLNQRLLTIKANLGFDRLQQMREASPTGGALGQVAVQELNALQSTVGSLEIGQDRAELQKNLNKVEHHYSNWIRTTQGEKPITFQEFMKNKQPAQQAAPASSPAAQGNWSIRPR